MLIDFVSVRRTDTTDLLKVIHSWKNKLLELLKSLPTREMKDKLNRDTVRKHTHTHTRCCWWWHHTVAA